MGLLKYINSNIKQGILFSNNLLKLKVVIKNNNVSEKNKKDLNDLLFESSDVLVDIDTKLGLDFEKFCGISTSRKYLELQKNNIENERQNVIPKTTMLVNIFDLYFKNGEYSR